MLTYHVDIPEWQFNQHLVRADRLEYLDERISFTELAISVSKGEIITFSLEPGKKEAKGCCRGSWVVKIPSQLLDLFFNGGCGYRAQFYLAPDRGIQANRLIIDRLIPRLLTSSGTGPNKMKPQQLEASLRSRHAKIWIDEETSTLDQTAIDPLLIQALNVPRWVAAMNQALSAWAQRTSPEPYVARSLLGVQAPEGERLIIVGAWMDTGNVDHVVPSKENSAEHIHNFGFS